MLGSGLPGRPGRLPRLPCSAHGSAHSFLAPRPLLAGVPELWALGRLTHTPVQVHQAWRFPPDAGSAMFMESLPARPAGPGSVVALGRLTCGVRCHWWPWNPS